MIATIGYEKSSLKSFIAALRVSEIEVIVDIRDRAQSRKPGFSKSALSSALSEAGIAYIHFRELGDPKEGREAARAGRYEVFQSIFKRVMAKDAARNALEEIEKLAQTKRICLMCYERDHRQCHRNIVSDHLKETVGCNIVHLGVNIGHSFRSENGRVLYTRKGTAA